MELLNLQSSLQSEIQAKQIISEDLSKTRTELMAAHKWVVCYYFITLKKYVFVPSITKLFFLYFAESYVITNNEPMP